MVSQIQTINYQRTGNVKDNSITRCNYGSIPKALTIEGVVYEIDGENAEVVLDINGKDESRIMSTKYLQSGGIRYEGQSFELNVSKESKDGRTRTTTWVNPVGDPTKVTIVSVRQGLDLSKFKRK